MVGNQPHDYPPSDLWVSEFDACPDVGECQGGTSDSFVGPLRGSISVVGVPGTKNSARTGVLEVIGGCRDMQQYLADLGDNEET